MRPGPFEHGGVPVSLVSMSEASQSSSHHQGFEDQENSGEILKLRHATSNVWSEIRGAIRAIGRSTRDGMNRFAKILVRIR